MRIYPPNNQGNLFTENSPEMEIPQTDQSPWTIMDFLEQADPLKLGLDGKMMIDIDEPETRTGFVITDADSKESLISAAEKCLGMALSPVDPCFAPNLKENVFKAGDKVWFQMDPNSLDSAFAALAFIARRLKELRKQA